MLSFTVALLLFCSAFRFVSLRSQHQRRRALRLHCRRFHFHRRAFCFHHRCLYFHRRALRFHSRSLHLHHRSFRVRSRPLRFYFRVPALRHHHCAHTDCRFRFRTRTAIAITIGQCVPIQAIIPVHCAPRRHPGLSFISFRLIPLAFA